MLGKYNEGNIQERTWGTKRLGNMFIIVVINDKHFGSRVSSYVLKFKAVSNYQRSEGD